MPAVKPDPAIAVESFRAALQRCRAERSRSFRRQARRFYPLKRAELETFALAHGFDAVRVIGAAAAFSPGIDPANDLQVLRWLAGIGADEAPSSVNRPAGLAIPRCYATFVLAHGILYGQTDPFVALPADRKRGQYFRAILGDAFAWVIDVHCWRDMLGLPYGHRDVPLASLTPKQYLAYAAAFAAAGLTSADQAEAWADRRA